MSFKKVFTNIITFGASGRIEKRYEEYQYVYRLAENKKESFHFERDKAITNLENLAHQRIISAELLTSLQEEYFKLKNKYPVLNSFNTGYLKRNRNLDVGLTAEDIANNTILGLSHGLMIGIDVIVATSFVTNIISAKTTTAVGTTKISALSSITSSKITAIGTASSLKIGGIGLAGKGAIGAAVPVAIPFVLLSMAFFSHRDANKQIENINFHERKLNDFIKEMENNITECKKIQISSEEKLTDLTFLSSCIAKEYSRFEEITKETFDKSKIFNRFIMKICLFLNLPNKKLTSLRIQKKEVEKNCEKIHSLIRISIA